MEVEHSLLIGFANTDGVQSFHLHIIAVMLGHKSVNF